MPDRPSHPQPILVALLHETLKTERFDTMADVADALKTRAARLRIPYNASAITDALTIVQRSRLLVRDTLPRVVKPDTLTPEPAIVSREDAGRIVRALWRRASGDGHERATGVHRVTVEASDSRGNPALGAVRRVESRGESRAHHRALGDC